MTQLRLQGIDDIAQVELAAMEGNGEVSVIRRSSGDDDARRARDPRAGAG